jgi:hypothetical protein
MLIELIDNNITQEWQPGEDYNEFIDLSPVGREIEERWKCKKCNASGKMSDLKVPHCAVCGFKLGG